MKDHIVHSQVKRNIQVESQEKSRNREVYLEGNGVWFV